VATASVTVMGAGVAGLCAALILGRDGRRVTLLERDAFDLASPEDAPTWPRRGIPHFLQPHAFIPRGRADIEELFNRTITVPRPSAGPPREGMLRVATAAADA
jgi:flavin-dependent dehydrogenase